MGIAYLLDWSIGAGLVFGLALSVASTVVLLRALQERRLIETERGRIAVGWLVVEDFVMILTLVLLPALAGLLNGSAGVGAAALAVPVLVTLGKVAAFVAVMLVIGKRLIPAILHWVAHSGSRELFRLSVLAIALGVAFGATQVFDVSFALGAFFAGMILSESELSHRAAQETLPLRDAFAVLFFVSVGMLVDPGIVVRDAGALLAVVLIVVIGKSVAAFAIVRLFGYPNSHALTVSASLAQIGEFSFILAGLGVSLALLPERGRDLILAGAIISILLNPVLFALLDWTLAGARARKQAADAEDAEKQSAHEGIGATQLSGHVVLVGHGRVGRVVSARLKELQIPLLLIEENRPLAAEAREAGLQVIHGNATSRDVLADCNLAAARCLLVAIPDAFEGGQIVSQARAVSGSLHIVARSHSDEETEHLEKLGASSVVMGEREIAMAMLADIGDSGGPGPGASTT
jgi:CPA2 family monovalent cation:H+ antiporter-2